MKALIVAAAVLGLAMSALAAAPKPAPTSEELSKKAAEVDKRMQDELKKVEEALASVKAADVAKPRKVLVFTLCRGFKHDSIPLGTKTLELMGKKTGAFSIVASDDPNVFDADNLKQFDAVVMNNTHEATPFLPLNLKDLTLDEQNEAKGLEEALKKSFQDFLTEGKGLVGIHGASCSVKWPQYMEMLGGTYAGHTGGSAWIKAEDPAHPLCAMLPKEGFEASDEFYILGGPYSRQKVRVLTSLDLTKTDDPQKLKVKDYPVSWIRECGKGRVFYCSLGHSLASYKSPHVLRHVLAGIQYAIGDLAADATPSEKPSAPKP
jgi:hypothetical protein